MRQGYRIVLGCAALLALTVACGRHPEAPRSPMRPSTVVRSETESILMPRIVVAQDTPYIFYFDSETGTVSVAWPGDSGWNREKIDGVEGQFRGVGLSAVCACATADPAKQVFHLSYQDSTAEDLIYATGRPGSWTTENIKPGGEAVASTTAVAIGDKGRPWVFYTETSAGSIGLLFRDADGVWQYESADVPDPVAGSGGYGGRLSAAFDLRGAVYVGYQDLDKHALRIAERSADGQWSKATIEGADGKTDVGSWLSVQAAPAHSFDLFQSFPRVAYWDGKHAYLKYASRATDGSGWKTEIIDDSGFVGSDVSLVIMPDGTPVVTYLDEDRLDLKVALKRSGQWATWTEDDRGATGEYTSAAIDVNGDVHVAYFNRSDWAIKYRKVRIGG